MAATSRLTRACAEAVDQGCPAVPGRPHTPCTGCDCPCHHVTPPHGFRALVEQHRKPRTTSTPEPSEED